jgi:hypothetical protein
MFIDNRKCLYHMKGDLSHMDAMDYCTARERRETNEKSVNIPETRGNALYIETFFAHFCNVHRSD